MNINRVVLSGNLTRDPELRTHGETTICNMRLAVNNRVKREGEWQDKACYFDVAVFGTQAENCAKYLSKGRPVALDGRLDWREWTTDSGDKRQSVQVLADQVQFLDDGKREDRDEGAPATVAADDDIPF